VNACRSSLSWVFVLVGMVVVLVAAAPLASAESTARAALKQATASGQAWQSDAVLTHVSTLTAKADGRSRSWLYTFYSPKTGKSAIVTARDTQVEIEPDVRTTSVDPIGEFIDSDKALDVASQHGLTEPDSIAMGLTLMGKATAKPQMSWSITVMKDSILTWSIDAKNGSLIHKGETKY
jgi:hypothetical protein